jgi:hypothetical protein
LFTRYYPNQVKATGVTRAEIGQVKDNESVTFAKAGERNESEGIEMDAKNYWFEWYHGCGSKVEATWNFSLVCFSLKRSSVLNMSSAAYHLL